MKEYKITLMTMDGSESSSFRINLTPSEYNLMQIIEAETGELTVRLSIKRVE